MLNWLNRINDMDLTWVGFRWLRPAPEQNMSARVVTILCLVYCPLSAGAAFLITRLLIQIVPQYSANIHYPTQAPWFMALGAAIAFILLQSLLAAAWNRRAKRLRAECQRTLPKP